MMSSTAIFQPDLFKFLRQLKRHNDREWFAKNKARYQQIVVEPAMPALALHHLASPAAFAKEFEQAIE
jgi:uncharacterized protein (DUF2461 family)